jgi:hypothetical protein
MEPNTSVKQFIERMNEMNRHLLNFPEEFLTQLDQDEIIEILDQAKSPDWFAPVVLENIVIIEMHYEEAASYFKGHENLEKL